MEKLKNEFNLINGTFKGSETSELLSALFLNKIHFHSMKNFSHQERFGTPDVNAKKRIQILEQAMEEALNFLKNYGPAEEFEIHADIKIKPVNKLQTESQAEYADNGAAV